MSGANVFQDAIARDLAQFNKISVEVARLAASDIAQQIRQSQLVVWEIAAEVNIQTIFKPNNGA